MPCPQFLVNEKGIGDRALSIFILDSPVKADCGRLPNKRMHRDVKRFTRYWKTPALFDSDLHRTHAQVSGTLHRVPSVGW